MTSKNTLKEPVKVTILLEKEQYTTVKKLLRADGVSLSQIVRRTINEYIVKKKISEQKAGSFYS
jgi:hypothetical protein